jgi:cyclopropane fatty-acyl-phospholipid synthase-like methyltransferase
MNRWPRVLFLVFLTLLLGIGRMELDFDGDDSVGVAYAEEQDRDSTYIAPFVPTPQEVVDRMLELAQVSQGDLLYDLGSGDGRIVITAARRYGAQAVGFEIDPALVTDSKRNIKEAGVEALAEIRDQDVRTVDLTPASVVTMYLYPGANLRLRAAIMRQLKPGSRVVSHDFSMGDWKPDRVERMTDSAGFVRTIYLWRIGDSGAR